MTGPRHSLIDFARRWPGIWRIVDTVRQSRRQDDPAWPDHVFLPMPRAGEALAKWHAAHDPRPLHPSTLVRPAADLSCLAAWRVTQGVYRFDPALYGALVETRITGDLPGDLLRRMPEWCVYIETPDLETATADGSTVRVMGVWCWLDWDERHGHDLLGIRIHADGATGVTHLPLAGTLDEALGIVEDDWREGIRRGNASGYPRADYREHAAPVIEHVLSLLLYICAEEPDIDGRPERPRPKRTKDGWRLFPAKRERIWSVGERIGAALRDSYQRTELGQTEIDPETGRARPRAHIRRAHWHSYRVGPGRNERVLRWIAPTVVAADGNELPVTVRPVR